MIDKEDKATSFIFTWKLLTASLFISGILLFVFVQIINGIMNGTVKDPTFWVGGLLDFVKYVSFLLISTGTISVIMKTSTLYNHFFKLYNDLLKRVLNADLDLSGYSVEILRNLKRKVIMKIYDNKIDTKILDDSVYCLDENFDKLILGLYHESHEATFWINPDDEKHVFKKKVNYTYNIHNNFALENHVRLMVSFLKENHINTREEKLRKVQINKFKINGTNLLPELQDILDVKELEGYNTIASYAIILQRTLQDCVNHNVEINYEYDVPMCDFTQSFKLVLPCKYFRHKIFLEGNNINKWEIDAQGFASFFNDGSSIQDQFSVSLPSHTSAEIEFKNWVIPGAGYVISFRKNFNN